MTKKVPTSLNSRNICWSHEPWSNLVQGVLLSSAWPSLISAPVFQQIFQQSQESTWGTSTVLCPLQAQLSGSLSWRDERCKQPQRGRHPCHGHPHGQVPGRSWCREWKPKSVPSGASRLPVWENSFQFSDGWPRSKKTPLALLLTGLGQPMSSLILSHNYKPLQCCRKTNLWNLHIWQSSKDGRKHLSWFQSHVVQGPHWNWCH